MHGPSVTIMGIRIPCMVRATVCGVWPIGPVEYRSCCWAKVCGGELGYSHRVLTY